MDSGGLSLSPRERPNARDLSDAVFAILPEAGLELNVVDWFRLADYIGYRWVNGADGLGGYVRADAFNSVVWSVTLRFGDFGTSSNK